MNYRIKVKKLGNKWYLDIDHLDPRHIEFNEKLCRVFNIYDIFNQGQLDIYLIETYNIVYDNTVFINDEDLLRYFTTSDAFDIRFIVKDHEFSISSDMYDLLECQYNPNFHKTYYNIEIHNWTI